MARSTYSGTERRHYERRLSKDRRRMIRFEPGAILRRCGEERRKIGFWQHENMR